MTVPSAPVNRRATNTLGSQLTVPGNATPLGYQQITSTQLATCVPATVPAGANWALIEADTQQIRWRDDGGFPTSAVGMLLPVNTPFEYKGNLKTLFFIYVTSGANLNISFYA